MKIVIYGKVGCKYCVLAKELATQNNDNEVDYIDIQKVGIDGEALSKIVGKPVKTIPQIFIDDVYVGGYEELKNKLVEKDVD